MSYEDCLKAAGATVEAYETFGSYQGDWWAKVSFGGTEGYVHGYYGSCSGCDPLEAELPTCYDDYKDSHDKSSCKTCQRAQDVLVRLGAEYLSDMLTKDQAIEKASKNLKWDLDAEKMVRWIKEN